MCGRFAMIDSEEKVMHEFQIQHSEVFLEPRYNISPSQDIPVIVEQDSSRKLEILKWGLIPSWASNPKPLINARSETVTEKPSFRKAFRKRRCLIPASGFFEWTREINEKQPYFICLKNKNPIAFAGLWEEYSTPEGNIIKTCAILTIEANSYMQFIHHRMPVILTPANGINWLNQDQAEVSLKNLLKPFNSDNMESWRVSRQVNSPAFDNPNCLKKLDKS